MVVTFLVAGLVLASLPTLARPLGRRLRAREWTVLCFVALVGGAALVEGAFVVWAAPALFDASGLAGIARSCTAMLGLVDATGWPGSAAAFGFAVLLPALGIRSWARIRARTEALRIEPELGIHVRRDGLDMVTLPSSCPLAYCVAGPEPQVVVSSGLADLLTAEQFTAVVAHERAHLLHEHGRVLRLGAVAASLLAWWPPARRSHLAMRAAIERWADDDAVGTDPRARRDLRSALVEVVIADPPVAVPALSLAAATAERVAALDGVRPVSRGAHASLYVPGSLAAIVVGVTVASCLASLPAWEAIRDCCSI